MPTQYQIDKKSLQQDQSTKCCKKWFQGKITKFYTSGNCAAQGAVDCSAPDPVRSREGIPGEGGVGGDQMECQKKCREQFPQGRHKGASPGDAYALRNCLQQCGGVVDEIIDDDDRQVIGTNPCSNGGYQLTQEAGFPGGGGDPWAETPGMTRSGEWEGHYVWDPATKKYYKLADAMSGAKEGKGMDLVCKKYHKRTVDDKGGVWCCPSTDTIDEVDTGGEFQWSGDFQDLLARIMERANQMLDYPRGLTPQERQAVINYAIEGVKAGVPGEKQTTRDELARIGMAGSGFQATEMSRIDRETREKTGDVRRQLAIDELDRRFSEIMGTTGMAQSLTNTLMQSEQIPEILSGARRAEGQAAINSFLAYWGNQQGQGSGYNEAIMNRLMRDQGQGGMDMSWLYYLPYLKQ